MRIIQQYQLQRGLGVVVGGGGGVKNNECINLIENEKKIRNRTGNPKAEDQICT
jgi:hypothetical protein